MITTKITSVNAEDLLKRHATIVEAKDGETYYYLPFWIQIKDGDAYMYHLGELPPALEDFLLDERSIASVIDESINKHPLTPEDCEGPKPNRLSCE